MTKYLFWILIAAVGPLALAQAAPVVGPQGDVTYEIKVTPHDEEDESDQPRRKKKVQGEAGEGETKRRQSKIENIKITRYQDIVLYQLTWSDGVKNDSLQHTSSGTLLQQSKWSKDVVVARTGFIGLPEIVQATDKGLTWIKDTNRVGQEEIDGRLCWVHEQTVTVWVPREGNSTAFGPVKKKVRFKAWIDAETKRPVAFDDTEAYYEVGTYQPYSGPFSIPEHFRKPWERLQARLRPHPHL